MDGLQVGGVVVAGDEPSFKLCDANDRVRCLTLSELGSVTNPEVVSQHGGARVDVWIVVSHRPNRTRAAGSQLLRANWPEQIGQRLAGGDPQCPDVELLIRELAARPPIK
jgi:hypothetical protein